MMTDYEINKQCALATGRELFPQGVMQEPPDTVACRIGLWAGQYEVYSPLTNEQQCFWLIQKFRIDISSCEFADGSPDGWIVFGRGYDVDDNDLKRAVCLLVCKMTQDELL